VDIAEKIFKSQKPKVKVMTFNGGGIHLDSVASMLTCFTSYRVGQKNRTILISLYNSCMWWHRKAILCT